MICCQSLALTSCTNLYQPTNVQINENSVLMWDAMENARDTKIRRHRIHDNHQLRFK